MSHDLNFLSSQLLERLANSIHDRDSNNKQFCFSINEIHVVEDWLNSFLEEFKKKLNEY